MLQLHCPISYVIETNVHEQIRVHRVLNNRKWKTEMMHISATLYIIEACMRNLDTHEIDLLYSWWLINDLTSNVSQPAEVGRKEISC